MADAQRALRAHSSREISFLKRRDRLSVYIDILEAIREEQGKDGRRYAVYTRIMYRSNLSSKRLKERLLELSYIGLVEWNEQGVRLTEKGWKFLEDIKPLLKVLECYGLRIKR